MIFRFLDDGDAGGGVTPEADAKAPDATQAAEGGTGDGGGGSQENITPEKQIEILTKQLADKTSEYDGVAKSLGKQSSQIKTLKDLHQSMKNNPKGLIEQIARNANLGKVQIGTNDAPDFTKVLTDGTAEEQTAALDKRAEIERSQISQDIKALLDPIMENAMATKHADWDNMSDTRDAIEVASNSGNLTTSEMHHYAARGMNLENAINDAKKLGREEYIAELAKKNQEQITTGSPGKEPTTQKAASDFESILGELHGS